MQDLPPRCAQLGVDHIAHQVMGEAIAAQAAHSWSSCFLLIIMSCGKGVTATCAHLLVERGLLDLDTPVAHYWPQFAANGKATIPVSYLLSHRAGLPSFPPESGITGNELLDWNRCVTVLAEMKPLWTPGTAFMYHSLTYGYLVGEVIRRITGKTVGQFLAAEVAGPLNLDLWIGLPEQEEYRVAPVFSSAPYDPVSATMGQLLNAREVHVAEIPSRNGIGNARSLAKMYAAIIGEVDGVRLLSRDTVERACKPQTDGLREVEPASASYPLRFGLGYELSRTGVPMLGTGSFGHSGAGGRLGFVHPEAASPSGMCATTCCGTTPVVPMTAGCLGARHCAKLLDCSRTAAGGMISCRPSTCRRR